MSMPSSFSRFIMPVISFPANLISCRRAPASRDFVSRMLSNCALYDCTMYPSANPVRATRGFPDFCEASREIVSVALKFSRQRESSLDLIRLVSFVIEFTGESGASRPSRVENTFTEANHSYLALVISAVGDIHLSRKMHVYSSWEGRYHRGKIDFFHTRYLYKLQNYEIYVVAQKRYVYLSYFL